LKRQQEEEEAKKKELQAKEEEEKKLKEKEKQLPPLTALSAEEIEKLFNRIPEDRRLKLPTDPDEEGEMLKQQLFPDRKTAQKKPAHSEIQQLTFPPPPTPPKSEKELALERSKQEKLAQQRQKDAKKEVADSNRLAFLSDADRKKEEVKTAKRAEKKQAKEEKQNEALQQKQQGAQDKYQQELQKSLEEAQRLAKEIVKKLGFSTGGVLKLFSKDASLQLLSKKEIQDLSQEPCLRSRLAFEKDRSVWVKPATRFDSDTKVTVNLTTGARAAYGTLATKSESSRSFSTVAPFAVVSGEPKREKIICK